MNMKEFLGGTGPVLFDGGTGSEFVKRGLQPGAAPESLNLENRDLVRQLHREYIDAGSDVIETNTFGGNRKRLEACGLGGSVFDVNRAAADIALSEAKGKTLVAASVGPLGALIEPYGNVSVAEALDVYAEQVRILRSSGIEFVLIETMISLEEALIALEAAHVAGATRVGVTLTFEPTPEGPRTPFGEHPSDAWRELLKRGADITGANCGSGLGIMNEIIQGIGIALPPEKILIQPNAGIPSIVEGELVYPVTPDQFADFAKGLLSKKIRFVGGCCGTTPAHIAAARTHLSQAGA